ncbi:MAG: hypothetical protein H7067_10245 [Burkholderiales bacterium]|nr:hypothetical protein [Opitutaceae bacterium]
MTASPTPPDPDAIPTAPAPNRRRRLWLIAGIIGLLFATISAVIVYSDAPEPETSDLAPRRIELADEENFYVQLSRLAKSLNPDDILPYHEPDDLPEGHPARMPTGASNSDYDGFSDFLAAGHGWTPARLAKWDARLAQFASACEALLHLEKSQAPLPNRIEDLYANHELERIASQLSVAAGLYWQAGDRQRALEILATAYRCGARLTRSSGSLGIYLRGAQLQLVALSCWQRWALADPAAAEAVAGIWRACREPEPEENLREAMRAEHHEMSLAISAHEDDAAPYGPPAPVLFTWLARTRVLYPLVYKPNLTRALYADHVRTVIEFTRFDAATYHRRSEEISLRLEPRDLLRPVNLYGRMILSKHDSTRWAAQRRFHYLTEESLFDAVVALRRYHSRHGELPETLATLVPDYLDAVPIDHLDGAPLRYSKGYCAVWSIGPEGIGKPEAPHPPSRKSLNQRLDFAIPPDTTPITPPPAAPPTAGGSPPRAGSASP